MGPDQLVFFWLITSSLALFAMIFGIRYLNNKENMSMIEKGIDPKIKRDRPAPAPFRNLKWGLVLVGAGIGLFLAYLLDNFLLSAVRHAGDNFSDDGANVPIYFALIAIGGGLGLIISYRIEKKEVLDKPESR
ncbi:MAG TPA: DUF6249 domain-containing protein [Puia sp.]|jgi:hypothetical protein